MVSVKDMSESGAATSRFWCIENFSMAETLNAEDRSALHDQMEFAEYNAGEAIYFPGDPSDTVYSVRHGRVRLTYLDETGKRLTFAFVGRGQLFGETALAGEESRNWLAEAVEDTTVCIIHKDDLLSFAARNPALALRIGKEVGERLAALENKLEDMLFKSVSERLSLTLLKLSEEFGDVDAEGVRIRFNVTHQELANLIGATRETTSLALADFERDGLLTKQRGKITLKDLDRLRKLS